ncbi:MAG: HAMP domain-containing sensor histidine kinase [Gemmatimonadota bacterium]
MKTDTQVTGKTTTDERARLGARRSPEHGTLVARTGEAFAGDVPADLRSLIERSVHRVQDEWPGLDADSHLAEEIQAHNTVLHASVLQSLRGEEPDLTDVPRSPLSRHLLELIRRSILSEVEKVTTKVPSDQVLRVLCAMERVSLRLDPDWAQHFADRLSGPNGLELVVEVAHDIRSPLTSILFLAETLQRGRSGAINDIQERQLGLIYSAAFGLSSMASDVIELARGGDRLVDLDPIPFSVTDILESVRDIVLPIAEEKGLGVRLSPPGSDFRIGHPVALSRVLLNLTTNALKFTDEGNVEMIAKQTSRMGIEFSVRDTGRGIPPQAMNTLFLPFRRRVKSGDYKFSGAGLGLSICRKLVEAMGAELKVDTAPDAGTRFYFELDLPQATQL